LTHYNKKLTRSGYLTIQANREREEKLKIQGELFIDERLEEFWQRMSKHLTQEEIEECKKVRNVKAFKIYCKKKNIASII